MLKVRTLFSGIGSPEIALRDLQIPFELIDFCEIDKYAVKSYCAIHNVDANKNLGDISKVWGRNLPYADLLVWGFPCTDISVAGRGAGIVEGTTRSGLYYEGLRILRETKPKYSIIENVKNLTGKKFQAEFQQILKDTRELGYNNYWQVLNAKNYGIPQNRERVFIVSIRVDVDDKKFEFPVGFDNGLRLKDFLEDEVEEKFYIPQEKVEQLLKNIDGKIDLNKQVIGTCHKRNDLSFATRDRVYNGELQSPTLTATMYKDAPKILKVGNTSVRLGGIFDGEKKHQAGAIWDKDGLCPTLDTMQGGYRQPSVIVKEATKKGYVEATVGDSINIQFPNSTTRRGRVGHEVAQILETSCNQATMVKNKIVCEQRCDEGLRFFKGDYVGTLRTIDSCGDKRVIENDYRIRKLTPKECYRLMGFSDEDFERAKYYSLIESEKLFKTFPNRKFKINSTHEERFKNRIERMSDSQLYKQAGNSIVSNVLAAIFKNLLQKEITQLQEDDKELS